MLHAALWMTATALAGPRGVVVGAQAPDGLDEAWDPRRVALVVGIDRYQDPALQGLRYAGKDAVDLARVLSASDRGAFEVHLVTSADGPVSRERFWEAFEQASARLQPDDTFLVYFAGHGTLDLATGGTEHHLLTSGSSLDRPAATGIPRAQLQARLGELPARRRVIVLDACFSGGGRSQLAPDTQDALRKLRGPAPPPPAPRFSRYEAWLFAAVHHQAAQEDPRLENGVYTHFLVRGLEGEADLDGDGLVDVLEAHQWALDGTLAHTGGGQVPLLYTERAGRSDIYLAGDPQHRGAAEWAVLSLERLPQGAQLLVNGQLRGSGAVEPGRHHFELRLGDASLLDEELEIEAGDWLDLGGRVARAEQGLAPEPPRWRLLGRMGAEGFYGRTGLSGGIGLDLRLWRKLWLGLGADSAWIPWNYDDLITDGSCEDSTCVRWNMVVPLHIGPHVVLASPPLQPSFAFEALVLPYNGFQGVSWGGRGRWGVLYTPKKSRVGLLFDGALGIVQDLPAEMDNELWGAVTPSWQIGTGIVLSR